MAQFGIYFKDGYGTLAPISRDARNHLLSAVVNDLNVPALDEVRRRFVPALRVFFSVEQRRFVFLTSKRLLLCGSHWRFGFDTIRYSIDFLAASRTPINVGELYGTEGVKFHRDSRLFSKPQPTSDLDQSAALASKGTDAGLGEGSPHLLKATGSSQSQDGTSEDYFPYPSIAAKREAHIEAFLSFVLFALLVLFMVGGLIYGYWLAIYLDNFPNILDSLAYTDLVFALAIFGLAGLWRLLV